MKIELQEDVESLLDKVNLIGDALELQHSDIAKIANISLEMAYFVLENQLSNVFEILMNSTVSKNVDICIQLHYSEKQELVEIVNSGLQTVEYWARSFRSSYSSSNIKGEKHVECKLQNLPVNSILDQLSINQLRTTLEESDYKLYASKSKNDLLNDLKARSDKLRETINNLAEIEKKSSEIEKLNQLMVEKNEELSTSILKAQEADRMKSQFLANMSHELRTPLNSILGFGQLLQDGLVGEVTEMQSEVINDILKSATHLLDLINQILDISKVEAGMMELHPEKIEINSMLNDLKTQVSPLLMGKKLNLELHVDEKQEYIFADSFRFKQVMINLLSNAIKFSSESNKIIIRVKKENEDALISVQDFGIGIKKDDLESVFQEFKQVDDSHTRAYQGTGLGLSLCKGLVELHGGKIWVESTFGKETTFFFTLPLEG